MHMDEEGDKKVCRKELRHNCLLHSLSTFGIYSRDTLAKMSNYFVNITHIPTHKLTELCNHFDLNIVLYMHDGNKGKVRIINDKNGGIYGSPNASHSFNIATLEKHYFEYEDVPVSSFYLKNRNEILEYGIDHNWELEKMWKVNQKNGNTFKVNKSKCSSMSSLTFIRTLFEMGAFKPLYRNDPGVDIAKVHHYAHNKEEVTNLK